MAAPVASSTPAYRKLTRLHRGVGMMSQLWLGPDHLLHVQSTGYSESYRRFYLREIQSLIIVHTGRRTYVAVVLVLLLLIVGAIVVSLDGGIFGFGIVAGLLLPFFIWNHLLGEGCRVVVVTAVQQDNVASLSRLPKTRRVLAELKPLIEAAQADLLNPPAVGPVAAAPVVTDALPPPLPLS